MKRIVVFGATGPTGRRIVRQALQAGHRVTALARRPDHGLPQESGMRVVLGSISDATAVLEAVDGQDVVLSALGTHSSGPVSVCTDGARATLAAMRVAGVRRLVAVSAFGAGETKGSGAYALMLRTVLADKMRDKDAMEALVAASDVDWTLVRPPRLTDGKSASGYRVANDLRITPFSKISRANLADFMLKDAVEGRFVRQFPRILE